MDSTPTTKNRDDLLLLKQQVMSAIGAKLGTYTRTDNTKVPAIYVSPPDPPVDYRPFGIECIISETTYSPHSVIGGGGRLLSIDREYSVVLVQHESRKDLEEVKVLLVKYLTPLYVRVDLVHIMPSMNALEQLNLTLAAPYLLAV